MRTIEDGILEGATKKAPRPELVEGRTSGFAASHAITRFFFPLRPSVALR
jgi:hypothetical protein